MPEKKCAVVTGGAGFIGSHLCERLVKEGYRVISLDNYFTGSKDNHIAGVEYREGHTKDIARLVPEDPDIIYHLGEYSRVEQSVLEPEVVHNLNVVGTAGVVAFWKAHKCKLVYAGSSTKFGDSGAARFTSPYAQTKAANSELVRDEGEQHNLPYAITYFYNVYGPGERSGVYGTVIQHFKQMYLSGAPCAVVLPGTQKRNFTHVCDIVDALVLVGEHGHGDEYGLGCEQAFSILEVANFFDFGTNTVFFPERKGNRMTSDLNTEKITALGWKAQRSLDGYISEFVSTHSRGTLREKRVLVFATTFAPVSGLAEDAFVDLAQALPGVHFDVVTTCFTPGARHTPSPAPNITLHRVGYGKKTDKFLLPILGGLKGRALAKKHLYLFAWSLMASYGALAALFVRSFIHAPLLITLADQNLTTIGWVRAQLLRLILSNADQIYGSHSAQEADAVRAARRALPRHSLGQGDAFANALRFAYADLVKDSVRP